MFTSLFCCNAFIWLCSGEQNAPPRSSKCTSPHIHVHMWKAGKVQRAATRAHQGTKQVLMMTDMTEQRGCSAKPPFFRQEHS